jgi:hypothetical protein
MVSDGPGCAQPRCISHVVVGRTNQVPGVPFLNELRHGSGGKQRDIIRVRLNCSQNFADVRPAGEGTFQVDVLSGEESCFLQAQQNSCSHNLFEKLAARIHSTSCE